MKKETIYQLHDGYPRFKDSLHITGPRRELKGEVSIFEKDKAGNTKLLEKSNMIVFSGREWLLERAFGDSLIDYGSNTRANYIIRWFGIGTGGGEAGNPLQAGATLGSDPDLYQQIRLRSDLGINDAGYEQYASKVINSEALHGYFKRFTGVTKREDHANPYQENGITKYPAIIAEIRVELSSDDANLADFQDINEAGLYISDPNWEDPGQVQIGTSSSTYDIPSPIDVFRIEPIDYTTTMKYTLNTDDLSAYTDMNIGDRVWTDNDSTPNTILQINPALITGLFKGDPTTGEKAYFIIDKADGTLNVSPSMQAHFINAVTPNYILFSRVTFSTIRKTVDRELVFLWKIYF